MKREAKFSKEKLYSGVAKLAEAVGSTLGPKGRPVLIEDQPGHPYPTKDGVTVARNFQLADSEENLGARLVAQAAASTVNIAGDGTTTSVVLTNEMVQNGESDVDFVKGLQKGSEDVLEYLKGYKNDMTPDMIKHIAHISANSDDKISDIITEAFIETGEDGIVDAVYNPQAPTTSLTVKNGSFVPMGFTHEHFITNVRQRTCELDEPIVLVSNSTLTEIGQIEHILPRPIKEHSIVIIGDTEKNFNEAFIANVAKGNFKGVIVNPGGRVGSDDLRALAKLLKGIYFDNANGNNFDYLSDNYWGKADKVVIGQGFSLFTVPSNDHVKKEIEDLKEMIQDEEGEINKNQLKTRLSMLNGKYATVTVGGATQAEGLETKDRVDDAIFAVGAAQKFGYLPGGGVALRDASNAIPKETSTTAFAAGYNFLLRAITAPYAQILENAGINPADSKNEYGYGIDASNGNYVNMIETGIIDPAYVTESALINSVSAASTLLLTKATLIIVKDETDQRLPSS